VNTVIILEVPYKGVELLQWLRNSPPWNCSYHHDHSLQPNLVLDQLRPVGLQWKWQSAGCFHKPCGFLPST
jgi:hypothetical protein